MKIDRNVSFIMFSEQTQKHKNKFNLPGSFDWTCQTYKNRRKDVIYHVRYIVKDIVI